PPVDPFGGPSRPLRRIRTVALLERRMHRYLRCGTVPTPQQRWPRSLVLAIEFTSSLLYGALKDFVSFLFRRLRKPDRAEIVQLRQRWRSEIEERLRRNGPGGYGEVIVRDVDRGDEYPDGATKRKGISA